MHKDKSYVVMGVSGRTGAAAANTLLEAGERVRVIVRDRAKGIEWERQGAKVAVADLADVAALTDAFSGAKGAYLISPPQYSMDNLFSQAETIANNIVQATLAARLPKLVVLSSIGADQPEGIGLIAMNRMLEQRLGHVGLPPVTFLRAAYFMENWAPAVRDARQQGILSSFLVPLDRAIPMVATTDIGRIGAEALREEWAGDRVIALEGPTAYSPNDVADVFAMELGRTVKASAIPDSAWTEIISRWGFSPSATAGFIEMTRALSSGHITFSDDTPADYRKGRIPLDTVVASIVQGERQHY